jgi:hypothetical protein
VITDVERARRATETARRRRDPTRDGVEKRRSALVRALLPGLVLAIALAGIVLVAPDVAGRLVREDGLVEWLQVALTLVALGFVARSAARRISPVDIVGVAILAELVVAELDLDRRMIGISIIDWRFFRRAMIPLPVRVLVAAVAVGLVSAFLVYAVRRWRELWSETHAGFRDGWAQLLVVGLVLFGIPQPCERCMSHVLPLPQYFLEESLELLGLLYVVLAMAVRSRRDPGAGTDETGSAVLDVS